MRTHVFNFTAAKSAAARSFNEMDRFLSKLDLRDIKIKPEGNQYLPDEEPESVTESNYNEPEIVEEEVIESFESPSFDGLDETENEEIDVAETLSASDQTATATLEVDETDADSSEYEDEEEEETEVLKVSAKSRPSAVAGAIAGVVRESGRAEVQAIGAGATNQAVKAVAIARDYLWESELDAVCLPEFIDVMIDNEERTAIRLVVEIR